ncbi:MAG TPA: type I 3-dehydroquinate dehydratase [Deltaproteobacteria bacterium]|nr:type I 3-dehydroquinate dehydratase [Deltaproteobacteria bacterium]
MNGNLDKLSKEVLEEYRKKIDEIDDQLLSLLESRMELVQEVAKLKKSSHLPVIDFKRERSILDRLSQKGKGILPLVTLQNIYREILGASRSYQTASMLPDDLETSVGFNPMLCLSIMERENKDVVDLLNFPGADIIEWRIDATSSPEIEQVLTRKKTPIICTNRGKEFGGFFEGSEEERINLLFEAAEKGADFIDVEFMEKTGEILPNFPEGQKIILSYHDFDETPSLEELISIAESMMTYNVFLVKIVTMARVPEDCLNILSLILRLRKEDQEVVAFCMGPLGKWTRIASLFLGAYLTYGAKSPDKLAAPGQLTIPQIRHLLSMLC